MERGVPGGVPRDRLNVSCRIESRAGLMSEGAREEAEEEEEGGARPEKDVGGDMVTI